ncbi:MAG: MFS transporter [Deltaproteobacteria bacterium]|nr:MFS transporter [Deltaproteobacteria bacterium]
MPDPLIVTQQLLPAESHPEVRKLWRITLVVQSVLGFTNGLYLFTYGPYFYEKFGGTINPSTAMLLTTILLGVRQGLVALFEVPTGALADAIGRAHVVFLSLVFRVFFFLFLSVIWLCNSPTTAFAWGLLASIAFALNYTFFNGAFSAWCVETLREKAPHVSYGWLSSRFYSYQFFAYIVGGVLAVYLYLLHIPFIGFLIAAFASFCMMGYSMSRMKEVRSLQFLNRQQVQLSTIARRVGEIIGKSAQVCSKTPVLFWIILAFGSYMFLLSLVLYLWPVYFETKMGNKAHFGRNWILIVVIGQSLTFIGSRLLVRLNQRWSKEGGLNAHLIGFRRIFIGACCFSALAIIALSLETGLRGNGMYLFPISVFVVMFSFGVIAPCFETLINAYIPVAEAQQRTTIMSAGSMFRSIMILVLAIPSGGASGSTTTINWAIPAVILLVSAVFANHFMKKRKDESEIEALEA